MNVRRVQILAGSEHLMEFDTNRTFYFTFTSAGHGG